MFLERKVLLRVVVVSECTELDLKREKEERERMERDKNDIISALEIQVNKMQSQFERILNVGTIVKYI